MIKFFNRAVYFFYACTKKGMQMQLDIDTESNHDIRGFTASLWASKTSEQDILKLRLQYEKAIDGFAYILHDRDSYTEKEVEKYEKRWLEIKADGEEPDFDVPEVGEPKPDHWHILCTFKDSRPLLRIAETLKCPPNMIVILRNQGKTLGGGFSNMLAYMTHITKDAQADEKFEYDPEDVKSLQFPTARNKEVFENFKDYEDFKIAYEVGVLHQKDYIDQVLCGELTPRELSLSHARYYLDHKKKILEARQTYVNNLPYPKQVFNYFVGVYDCDPEAETGRVGKGIASQIQAIACLKLRYPDVDFDEIMQLPEEQAKMILADKWIFWAGGSGVEIQSYTGQPVIIWEDARACDLIKVFGGINKLFAALDDHPKPMDLNIKYGAVQLKNTVNIFNGAQSYEDFTNTLREDYYKNGRLVKSDTSQVRGRFPFIIEISPSVITQRAELQYFARSLQSLSFSRTFDNNLIEIAQNNLISDCAETFGEKYIEIESKVIEEKPVNRKLTKADIPSLFREIPLDELPTYARRDLPDEEKTRLNNIDKQLERADEEYINMFGIYLGNQYYKNDPAWLALNMPNWIPTYKWWLENNIYKTTIVDAQQ